MAAGFCLLAAAAQGKTPGWMKPDFVVSSVVLDPAAPSAGSEFTATVMIVNQGDIPGDAGVVRLWASKSKTAKTGEAGDADQVLGLLEVGETRVLTFSLTAPDESGTFHARAFVDADGATKEKSDGNNQLTAVYTIDAPPTWMKPDFVVESLELIPAAPPAGETFFATASIVNQGDIPGDAGVVRLWASKSKTAKTGEAGDADQVLGLLEVGETRVLTFSLTAPDESGTFHARAFVDADGATKEKSDGNNQLTAVYTIDAPPTWMKPDFVVESLELIPEAPPAGGTFFATVTLLNQGDMSGDAGVVRMWASKPGNAQPGEAGDAEQTAGILAAGETRTLTFSLTASTKPGTHHVRAFVDADDAAEEKSDGNNQRTVTYTVDPAGPLAAEIELLNLDQVYDGGPRAVTAVTVPEGLAVTVSYDGSADAPVQAGTYDVAATVTEPGWFGAATGSLTVARAGQAIEFAALNDCLVPDVVDLSATASSGLPVAFSVAAGPAILDGNVLTFTGAGDVTVTASQAGDANWQAAEDAVRTFTVTKAPAAVTLSGLAQVYDGAAHAVTAETEPAGLTVAVTYNGSAEAPVNAGVYAVTATVDDDRYEGSATDSLQVARAPAQIELKNLTQVYDGGPKAVEVETNPDELPVVVTYLPGGGGFMRFSTGSTEPPVQAGTYVVEAFTGDENYEGYAGGTMEILPAPQTIDFPEIGDREIGDIVELAATASSGLPVEFSVAAGPAVLDDRTLSFTGAGEVSVMASQPGDSNWEPAPDVVRTFTVTDPTPVLLRTEGPVRVREGGEGRFFLRLDREPEAPVVVQVQRQEGDGTLDVQAGATRVFRASNWNVWQAVVLGASEDDNAESEQAVFRLSATGLPDQFIEAVTLDDDGPENLALGAAVFEPEGVRNADQMLDGVHTASTNYGYTVWTEEPPGAMVVDLRDVMTVSRLRLLNWTWVYRTQRYTVESSVDGEEWTLLVDAGGEDRHGWDDWPVNEVEMRYLRLTGVTNSAGDTVVFSELEVLGERPPLPPLAISKSEVFVREGGQGRFFLRLNEEPAQNVVLQISPVEGEGIHVQAGAVRVFRPTSWNVWQAVVLAADPDANFAGETVRFRISGAGFEDMFVDATVLDGDIGENLALHGSMAGTSANMLDNVIDGVHADGANYGYTAWSETPPGTMTLDLHSVATINRMRLLNWDWVYREHTYRIDSSVDGVNWIPLVDAGAELRHGWDEWEVEDRLVRYLRFTGLSNTANGYVCIAEWEVFGTRPPLQDLEISKSSVPVREGGQGRFFVRLTNAPTAAVLVRVDRVDGDESLRVQSGAVRAFTPQNWDVWQSVTLAAGLDDNAESETATFRVSAPGAADAFVTATTLDGDIGENLALAANGTLIWGYRAGVQDRLIDGVHDLSSNYGHVMWDVDPVGTTTLDLVEPATVSRLRLLNWDWTHQVQSYFIESSLDGENWELLVDTRGAPRHGWDDWALDGREVRYLRLTGAWSSAGVSVVIAELELYGERAGAKAMPSTVKLARDPVSAPVAAADEWDSQPISVLTSEGPEDDRGWNALDADPETVWAGQKAGGGYLVVEYAPTLVLKSLAIDVDEASLADAQIFTSLDAQEWTPLPEDLEANPVELNFLWVVFPDDGTEAVPRVLEIWTNLAE
jgi:hypothetical protein